MAGEAARRIDNHGITDAFEHGEIAGRIAVSEGAIEREAVPSGQGAKRARFGAAGETIASDAAGEATVAEFHGAKFEFGGEDFDASAEQRAGAGRDNAGERSQRAADEKYPVALRGVPGKMRQRLAEKRERSELEIFGRR